MPPLFGEPTGERFLLPIYVLALYAGYLLPIRSAVLAWREWNIARKTSRARAWRRIISSVGLALLGAGLAFAISLAMAEASNTLIQQFCYGSLAMYAAESESIATIGVVVFAEPRLRRYSLLGAIGLLCLFSVGLIEAI
jgi:hypothetical protein